MNGDATDRGDALFAVPLPGTLLKALPLVALTVWFTLPTMASLHEMWQRDYMHGYLVLLMAGWLAVRAFRRAPLAPFSPSIAGFSCLVLVIVVIIAADAATTQVIAQLALPLLWLAVIWSIGGAQNARRFLIPLGYLYVAIPIWNVFIGPLQQLTVFMVSQWLRAAGLPAFIEGNFFHVPSGTFEVEGGCAGLRYVVAAAALTVFVSLLSQRRLMTTVLFTALAVAFAIFGNWVRVFVTIVVGLSSEGAILAWIRDNHSAFGWVVFVLLMVPVVLVDHWLEGRSHQRQEEKIAVQPVVARAWPSRAALAACAALATGIWSTYALDRVTAPVQAATDAQAIEIPEIYGWERTADWRDERRPQFIGASGEAAGWYRNGNALVGAYIAHYQSQGQGYEVVSAPNRPIGESGPAERQQSMVVIGVSGGTIPFREFETSDLEARRLVWVGMRVGGKPATSAVAAKILQLFGILRGRYDAQALVLTAVCADACNEARSDLSRFAAVAAERVYKRAEELAVL